MKKETIIISVIVLSLMVYFVFLSYLFLIRNNFHEVAGVKCVRDLRVIVDYPYCSTVLDCMEDCSTVQAEFVEAKTVDEWGEKSKCFCYTNNGTENIWR